MTTARAALLGRDRDVELIADVLRAAREGHPGFIVITGEAGIGKSSLLEELSRMADEAGCLTMGSRASDYDHELPFGVFTDALDDYLASLDTSALASLAQDRLGAVAAVFPSLASIDHAVEYPATAAERFRVHRAVRELLARLAARRPLVLILDDLHWADDASLEMIAYLLRHPPQAEVMLAMALRPGQGEPGVLGIIDDIRGSPAVSSVDLGPLGLPEIRALVGDRADDLHRLSGGNPFYALQLAKSASDDPELITLDDIGVPATVGRAILAELAALSPEARGLAEAAAVVGDPFEIDAAAAAVGSSDGEFMDPLDELVLKDLVRVTEVPRRFRFRHPIVRSAVYNSSPPGIRLSCHQRLTAYLTEHGASSGEIAYHVEQTASRGDIDAVRVLRRAGEEAGDRAPVSAIRWFAAALRLVPEDADERLEILESLAASLMALGRLGEAFQALESAVALAKTKGDTPASLILGCARLETLLGLQADAKRRLETAYVELGDATSPEAVAFAIDLSTTLYQASDFPSSMEWGRRAAAAAESSEDRPMLAAAFAAQTMGAALSGQIGTAQQARESTREIVDTLSDVDVSRRLDALSNLAASEMYLDLYVDAVRHGERCLKLTRLTGQTHLLPVLTAAVGTCWWVVGDLTRSASVVDDAIDAARLAGNSHTLAWALFNRAGPALIAGDLDLAVDLTSESLALSEGFDVGLIPVYAGVTHAWALLETGEPAAAVTQMTSSAGGDDIPLVAGAWRPFYIEKLVRCHLALGDIQRAASTATWARSEAEGFAMDMPLLMADRAQAAVALAAGRAEEAIELASSAIRRSEIIGSRYHEVLSRSLQGRALALTGDLAGAIECLIQSTADFQDMGMVRHRDETEAMLRKLGHTIHRRSQPGKGDGRGVESLTGRELEIAHLVLDRRTNREIAEQLFLSTKTVETHMRHIFNKLGVSSRVEVARLLDASATRG